MAYCHSIDFGAKGYGNLIELAALQGLVAGELGRPAGQADHGGEVCHAYATESDYLRKVLAAQA